MKKELYIQARTSLSSLGTEYRLIQKNILEHNGCFQEFNHSYVAKNLQEDLFDEFLNQFPQYKKLDRSVQFILFLGNRLQAKTTIPAQSGINIASSRGASNLWEAQYKKHLKQEPLSVFTSPNTTLGNVSSHLSNHLNTSGINISHSITCSSSLHAIANAAAWIQSGMSDSFIVGGTESCISSFSVSMFKKLGIYSPFGLPYPSKPLEENPKKSSMILGEGAGLLLLSSEKNNALAKIEGIGFATEEFKHPAAISDTGAGYLESMEKACEAVHKKEIDLILLHAPGTLQGDRAEIEACKNFDSEIPIFSTKYLYGHTLGASGILNIDFALHLFEMQEFNIDLPYPNTLKNKTIQQPKKILINASGFGGNTVSILISKA
ncbi:MAG: beta-ketoacyl synthase [Flavobacteriales bacterium]|nr:beta-ketoacyl synthase [Flavobacteriales bacterium]